MEDKVRNVHTLIKKALKAPIFKQTFTHSSRKGIDFLVAVNDRMELVGDKILDLLLYDWLYRNTKYEKEHMDTIRKKVHLDHALSRIFDRFQLDKYVRKNPGQTLNKTIKANVMESFFYAAYFKGGLELAHEFWSTMILPSI